MAPDRGKPRNAMAKRTRARPNITLYLNRLVGLGYTRHLIGGFNISVSDAEVVGLASLTATKTVEGEFLLLSRL